MSYYFLYDYFLETKGSSGYYPVIERSWFHTWLGHSVVFVGHDTEISQCLFPLRETLQNVGEGGGRREGEVTSIPDPVRALGTRISFSVNRLLGL